MANSLYENIQTMTPVTGDTLVIPNGDAGNFMIINPATTLAALTITFPSTPYLGQRIGIVFSRAITALTLNGGTFNYLPGTMPAGGYVFYRYDALNSTWMDTGHDDTTQAAAIAALLRGKNFPVTTTGGTAVIYLTKDGLSTGAALFETMDQINPRFISNDPNLGVSYALTNSNKTLTITAVKQTFNGVTVVGINLLGSITVAPAPDGTPLNVYVTGKLNP